MVSGYLQTNPEMEDSVHLGSNFEQMYEFSNNFIEELLEDRL